MPRSLLNSSLPAASLSLLLLAGCAATGQVGGTAGGATPAQPVAAPFPWSSGGAKIGYVRTDLISQRLAEYRDADNRLKSENQDWQAEVARMESDVKAKETEFEEIRLILTPERKRELEENLVKMRKELASFRQQTWYDENSKYLKRRKELMEPIDARVNDAIWKVAEAAGVDIVFDTVAGNVVYAKPALDLTEKVLEELQK